MTQFLLHELHRKQNARFAELNGMEIVADYGDWIAEYDALRESCALMDLSFRSRLCLTGADRVRLLHGQVTNDVKRLGTGEGVYAALVTAKGKMQSDLNIYCLADELLLDFEPGLTAAVTTRLEKYIVSDDVQVVDVSPHYGLLSVQGPKAEAAMRAFALFTDLPAKPLQIVKASNETFGEMYLAAQPRLRTAGYDLFVPVQAMEVVADKLAAAVKALGGRAAGWQAFDTARVEDGLPRFGEDMDESCIPLECGIEARAVSYNKGCYVGQEVINRIHSIGHVNRELRQLRIESESGTLPVRADKLVHEAKEVGHVTSVVRSPRSKAILALGYIRRDVNQPGTRLTVRTSNGDLPAIIGE